MRSLAFSVPFLLIVVSACSSVPAVKSIQVVQMNDPNLTCPELQAEISAMENTVAMLSAEIDQSRSSAKMNDMSQAIGEYTGNYNPLLSVFSQSSRDSAEETAEIRDSYQRRRDTLMQQYHHKGCGAD